MYAFAYHRPATTAAALAALAEAEDGKVLAGGMTLIPTLKQRLASPSDLVDLGQIPELKGICEESDGIVIGATTTHAAVAASPLVRRRIPALAALAGGIGDPQVRHRGTIGGSVANNDPVADYPAGLLALGATVRTDRRSIPADEFFLGLFETPLEPDELITAVHFPVPDQAAYLKFPNPASRYALVGVAVARSGAGVRVAITGAGQNGVFRAADLEQALTADFTPKAVDAVTISPGGLNSDIHAAADYRAHLITVMTKRAAAACE